MKIRHLHDWNVSYAEAIRIQDSLSSEIVLKDLPKKIRYVAGADVSSSKNSNSIWAGVVVLAFPSLEKVEEQWVKGTTHFPYIPGLLSFREIPLILEVMGMLQTEPDLILCDGQGIAHPRALGIASHLGILLKRPTIGCAKKRLVGEFAEVGPNRGDFSPLSYRGKEIGNVVRTRTGVKPVFVSPGYGVTIQDATKMVLDCGGRYRIPEPVRQAHRLVNEARRLGS